MGDSTPAVRVEGIESQDSTQELAPAQEEAPAQEDARERVDKLCTCLQSLYVQGAVRPQDEPVVNVILDLVAKEEDVAAFAKELDRIVDRAAQHGHAAALRKALALGGSAKGEGFQSLGKPVTITTPREELFRMEGRERCGVTEPERELKLVSDTKSVTGHEGGVIEYSFTGSNPLMFAMARGDVEIATILLENGADVNGDGGFACPLLMLTQLLPKCPADRRPNFLRLAELLLEGGADPNVVEPTQNFSAAMYCAQSGLDEMLEALVRHGADLELPSVFGATPIATACGFKAPPRYRKGATIETLRLLIRSGAKLEPPSLMEKIGVLPFVPVPESVLRQKPATPEERHLADLVRFVIDNGGDAASPNSRATPEALAKRVELVEEFDRAASAFAVGDRIVVEGIKAKPKFNGKEGVVVGRCNTKLRYPVEVQMRDGPETISLKIANLTLRVVADQLLDVD